VPEYVKTAVQFSLSQYERQKDNYKLIDLVDDGKEKKEQEKALGSAHLELLIRVLYNKEELQHVFTPSSLLQKVKLKELLNLTEIMGGKIIEQEGCRFRPIINHCMGDIDKVETIPSLHKHHGKDIRNDDVSKLTIDLFRNLFERAQVKSAYQAQIDNFFKQTAVHETSAVSERMLEKKNEVFT